MHSSYDGSISADQFSHSKEFRFFFCGDGVDPLFCDSNEDVVKSKAYTLNKAHDTDRHTVYCVDVCELIELEPGLFAFARPDERALAEATDYELPTLEECVKARSNDH